MSAIRKTVVTALVSGVALAGAVQTAHAAEPVVKPIHIVKPYKAYGPATNKLGKKLQVASGAVTLTTLKNVVTYQVKGKAVNGAWSLKNHTPIKVTFTYTIVGKSVALHKDFVIAKFGPTNFTFKSKLGKLGKPSTLSVQVFQGKKHGAKVIILP
jgi:hypothetical protein